jgi:hypothetical protein
MQAINSIKLGKYCHDTTKMARILVIPSIFNGSSTTEYCFNQLLIISSISVTCKFDVIPYDINGVTLWSVIVAELYKLNSHNVN